MKRRILAIFMMVAMIITMVPIVALAEDELTVNVTGDEHIRITKIVDGNGEERTTFNQYSSVYIYFELDDGYAIKNALAIKSGGEEFSPRIIDGYTEVFLETEDVSVNLTSALGIFEVNLEAQNFYVGSNTPSFIVADGANYSIENQSVDLYGSDTIVDGQEHIVNINLYPNDGYAFDRNVKLNVSNISPNLVYPSINIQDNGSLYINALYNSKATFIDRVSLDASNLGLSEDSHLGQTICNNENVKFSEVVKCWDSNINAEKQVSVGDAIELYTSYNYSSFLQIKEENMYFADNLVVDISNSPFENIKISMGKYLLDANYNEYSGARVSASIDIRPKVIDSIQIFGGESNLLKINEGAHYVISEQSCEINGSMSKYTMILDSTDDYYFDKGDSNSSSISYWLTEKVDIKNIENIIDWKCESLNQKGKVTRVKITITTCLFDKIELLDSEILQYQNCTLKEDVDPSTGELHRYYCYGDVGPTFRSVIVNGQELIKYNTNNFSYGDILFAVMSDEFVDEQTYNNQFEIGKSYKAKTNLINTVNSRQIELTNLEDALTFNVSIKRPTVLDRIESIDVLENNIKIKSDNVKTVYLSDGTTVYGYNICPDLCITYTDGTVGYIQPNSWVLRCDDTTVLSHAYYHEANEGVFDCFCVAEGGQSVDQMKPGKTYDATIYILGYEIPITVTIEDAEFESFDITESIDIIEDDSVEPWCDYHYYLDDIYQCEDFKATLNYSDNSKKIMSLRDFENVGAQIDYIQMGKWEPGLHSFSITYEGITKTCNVNIIENPIESLKIVTVNKAYKNHAGEFDYYSYSGVGTTVAINGEECTCYKNIGNDWTYVDYNGVTYYIEFDFDADSKTVKAICQGVESNPKAVDLVNDYSVEKVTVIHEPNHIYYKNDSLTSSCMSDSLSPYDLRGLKFQVELSDGTKHIFTGDSVYYSFGGSESFGSYAFSDHGLQGTFFYTESSNCESDICILINGQKIKVTTVRSQESILESISVNKTLSKEQIRNGDYKGLIVTFNYKDGRPSQSVELTNAMPYDYMLGISIGTGVEIGDGGITPVDGADKISGLKFDCFRVKIGDNAKNGIDEYLTIVWNNGLLRCLDQILFLDTGENVTVNSNGLDVKVDNSNLVNSILDSLSLEDRYEVEQNAATINTMVDVKETEDISIKLKANALVDSADIVSAYDIDISCQLTSSGTHKDVKAVTDLGDGKILVTMELPDELKGLSADQIILYREHEYDSGKKVEQITDFTISEDGNYITFESSKFSTFALGYKDKKDVPPGGNGGTNNEKPILPETVEKIANTLDNTPIAATMMLVCSSGLCLFAVARKRKELE